MANAKIIKNKQMKIGICQLDVVFEGKEENIQKVRTLLAPLDFDLMVLPVLYATGSIFYDRKHAVSLADNVPASKTAQAIIEIAKEKKAWIVAGVLEIENALLYNTAIIAGPKGLMGKHRKVNLSMQEEAVFARGEGFETFSIKGVTVGIMICYDNCMPKAGEVLKQKGAQLICQPANHQGFDMPENFRSVAKHNKLHTISVNRVGYDHNTGLDIPFIGLSQIVNPKGEILLQAEERKEVVHVMDINLFERGEENKS